MKGRSILMLIAAGAVAASAFAQTRYMVTDTGSVLFGPAGINSGCLMAGEGVVGYAWDPVNGLVVVPGFPGGYSYPFDVNDSGEVTGYAYHADGSTSAMLWDPVNGTRQLAGFPSSSRAFGINNLGHVVGQYGINQGADEAAFIWKPGTGVTTLPDPGVSAGGWNLNGNDQVIGFVEMVLNGPDLAVIWQPDGSITYLGNLGNQTENIAFSINDAGYVCGTTFGPMGSVGYLWDQSGHYTQINDPYGSGGEMTPTDVNNHNVVCGYLTGPSDYYGFVWTQDSGVTIVDDVLAPGSSQWHVDDAITMNDNGQIAAQASLNGVEHAVLLSPIPQNVVIPDSYSLFRGTLAGGVLYCIQFQDALYLAVHPGKTITAAEPPVQVQVSGTSPTTSPKSFQFTFTGHVNTPHLTEGILLYNFQTGAYELLNAQAATTSDSTVTVTPTGDLSRFVDPATKEVRARVTFIPNGQIVFAAWTASLGLTDWTIQ